MDRATRIARKIASEIVHPFSGAESQYAEPLKKQMDYGTIEKLVKDCEDCLESYRKTQK